MVTVVVTLLVLVIGVAALIIFLIRKPDGTPGHFKELSRQFFWGSFSACIHRLGLEKEPLQVKKNFVVSLKGTVSRDF